MVSAKSGPLVRSVSLAVCFNAKLQQLGEEAAQKGVPSSDILG